MPGDITADVAIVGAGYTGLWTAYYLSQIDPTLRIVIVEAEFAGFGASGRNGGWLSALLPMSFEEMAAQHGRDQAVAMQRTMHDAVDEVATRDREGGHRLSPRQGRIPQPGAHRTTGPPGARAARALPLVGLRRGGLPLVASRRGRGSTAGDSNVLGAGYTPHCAAIHPARLVRGLAETVERAGMTIYEQTRVVELGDRKVRCETGTVSADVVVRATEGFTARLPGHRRTVAPIYSLMIATEPLPD